MIIVTGGAGFIGSNLVKALNDRGRTDVLVVDDLERGEKYRNLADLRISDYMDRVEFRSRLDQGKLGMTPDFVLHQGACADPRVADGRFLMENNFADSKAVLHYCLLHKVPLVYASSAAVYGVSTASSPDPAHERPASPYAYSKLAFDQHVRSLMPHAQSTLVGLRYFQVFGPREAHKGPLMSLPSRLFLELAQKGRCHLSPNAATQSCDLIHISDVVDLNLTFAGMDTRKGIFNAGTGTLHDAEFVALALIRHLGHGWVDYGDTNEPATVSPAADLRGLREAGYTKSFKALEAGLSELSFNPPDPE